MFYNGEKCVNQKGLLKLKWGKRKKKKKEKFFLSCSEREGVHGKELNKNGSALH